MSEPVQPSSLWLSDTRGRVIAALVGVISLLVVASLVSWFLVGDDSDRGGHTDRVVLAAAAVEDDPRELDGHLVTHLAITGGTPQTTQLEIALTTIEGEPLDPEAPFEVALILTSLLDGTTIEPAAPAPVASASTPTFRSEAPGFTGEGWWRIRAQVQTPDGDSLHTDFYVLLPDPNLTGFDSPPAPETDPDAANRLQKAITSMSEWSSVRWWQWLSGGNDSMITADFAVTTTEANGEPDSFIIEMLFGAGFEEVEGRVATPRRDYYTTITIGEDAWTQTSDGAFREAAPTQYLPINQYPQTYQGATSTVFGITEEIHGREAQVISFHVPTLPSQSEAWYTFWIDTDTGDLLQLAMIANNHYMVWIYDDINEPFVIEPPAGVTASPVASPEAP